VGQALSALHELGSGNHFVDEPMRSASCALTISPVRHQLECGSAAYEARQALGATVAGITPSFTSGRPSRASSAASRRVQAMAARNRRREQIPECRRSRAARVSCAEGLAGRERKRSAVFS